MSISPLRVETPQASPTITPIGRTAVGLAPAKTRLVHAPHDAYDQPPDDASVFGTAYENRLSTLTGHGASFTPTIKFLRKGDEAFQARLDAINNATSTIFMSAYAIEADEMTDMVLDAMIAKAKQGVKVVVKSDAFPDMYIQNEKTHDANSKMYAKMRELERAGGVIMFYAKSAEHSVALGAGDHFKILLTDGKQAIAGGRNMSRDYFTDWRDMDGLYGGSVATTLGRKALQMAAYGDPTSLSELEGDEKTVIYSRTQSYLSAINADLDKAEANTQPLGTKAWVMAWDPIHDRRPHGDNENENTISQALIETFDRAQHEIIVSSNYVNASPNVQAALVRAASRGVSVNITTTNETSSTRSLMPYFAAERHYGDIMKYPNSHIWEREGTEHGKMYVVDNEVAAFGSYNLEHAADNHLVEQLVFSRDRTFVDRVRGELLTDIKQMCTEYTGPKKRGFFESIGVFFWRMLGWLTETLL